MLCECARSAGNYTASCTVRERHKEGTTMGPVDMPRQCASKASAHARMEHAATTAASANQWKTHACPQWLNSSRAALATSR
eukprot:12482163-Alexandrium_andersonii.AAC.1